mmetsp:Transcript_17840/g.20548  ORF Transcript_17840/g.20548 Transcript_17840/m.20548 type:complete len:118 (-) Transcript_17840:80-433(-)
MGNFGSTGGSGGGGDPATRKFIQSEIDNNNVVIFSKTHCTYCSQTKQTFSSITNNNNGVKVYELDKMKNGSNIQNELQKMTGQRTVPNVWVKAQHIGGNDDTQKAVSNGKIQGLLAK